jgi:hypothetical protein
LFSPRWSLRQNAAKAVGMIQDVRDFENSRASKRAVTCLKRHSPLQILTCLRITQRHRYRDLHSTQWPRRTGAPGALTAVEPAHGETWPEARQTTHDQSLSRISKQQQPLGRFPQIPDISAPAKKSCHKRAKKTQRFFLPFRAK